jgi:hypothetical protein
MIVARVLRRTGILAALAFACLPAATVAQGARVPVIAAQNPGYDACGSPSVVRGLNPQGDGFLAVRAGPGSGYVMLDKGGYILNLCDQRGNSLGVFYSHETMDCGVGTPWPRPGAYTGPCLAGWVFRKYVGDFAG